MYNLMFYLLIYNTCSLLYWSSKTGESLLHHFVAPPTPTTQKLIKIPSVTFDGCGLPHPHNTAHTLSGSQMCTNSVYLNKKKTTILPVTRSEI